MQDTATVDARLANTPMVQFRALQEYIGERLGKGHRKMEIWKALSHENQISMSYNHFRTLCNRTFGSRKGKKTSNEADAKGRPSSGPVIARPPEKREFKWDLNPEELAKREFR